METKVIRVSSQSSPAVYVNQGRIELGKQDYIELHGVG